MALVTTSAVAVASPLSAVVSARADIRGQLAGARGEHEERVTVVQQWDGRMARARPLWATAASRWASAGQRASVATTPMVVFNGWGGGQGQRVAAATTSARAGRRTAGSAKERPWSRGTRRRVDDAARGIHRDQRGDHDAVLEVRLAVPTPPCERPGRPHQCRPDAPLDDRRRPRPQRTPASPRIRTTVRGDCRKSHPGRGRRSRPWARSARPGGDRPHGEAPPCSSCHAITPSAAASP